MEILAFHDDILAYLARFFDNFDQADAFYHTCKRLASLPRNYPVQYAITTITHSYFLEVEATTRAAMLSVDASSLDSAVTYSSKVYGRLHSVNGEPSYKSSNEICWHNRGQGHRDGGGPAVISACGRRVWMKFGDEHRDDGPAVIHGKDTGKLAIPDEDIEKMSDPISGVALDLEGAQEWYRRGIPWRENGLPTLVYANGRQAWRTGEPRETYGDGERGWFADSAPHRDGDLPAIVDPVLGVQHWYDDGVHIRSAAFP